MKKQQKHNTGPSLAKCRMAKLLVEEIRAKNMTLGPNKGLWQGEMGNINGFHGV